MRLVALCFVTGWQPFALEDACFGFPYLNGGTSPRICQSKRASPLARGINKPVSLNPNLASPAAGSERHRWYMCSSGRLSALSFLSVMDGGFCRPVNTQSEPHCPDLRRGGTRVTLTEARRFNHSEQQLHSARIGVCVRVCGGCLCVCVRVVYLVYRSVKRSCNHRAIGGRLLS